MFTGLVEGQGEITRIEKKRDKALLTIKPGFPWKEKLPGGKYCRERSLFDGHDLEWGDLFR